MQTEMDLSVHIFYDILLHVLQFCRNDYGTLFQCSIVNKEFNRAASKFLYNRAVYSPAYRAVLDLRDDGTISASSNILSASLPSNAHHVVSLEISGYLSTRPPPKNKMPSILLDIIPKFTHLAIVKFTPMVYYKDLFTEVLKLLKSLKTIRELTINGSCTDVVRAPLVADIDNLEKLTMHDPSRAILQLLPEWLKRLSPSLRELYLPGNCGSITPGVLTSIIPHARNSIRAFTLGLSYSLTDKDVFSALQQFENLESLQLRYYLQLTIFAKFQLRSLRRLQVSHSALESKEEVVSLCKWVRRAISDSPIEDLRIFPDIDTEEDLARINLSHDSLVSHLISKHSTTLRFLDFGSSFIRVKNLKRLFASCLNLEEFYICAGKTTLSVFSRYSSGLSALRLAAFDIQNTKRSKRKVSKDVIIDVFRSGPSSLKFMVINGIKWERVRVMDTSNAIGFVVQEVPILKTPWEEEYSILTSVAL